MFLFTGHLIAFDIYDKRDKYCNNGVSEECVSQIFHTALIYLCGGNAMRKIIVLILFVCITLLISTCSQARNDDWVDDGKHYLCSECWDKQVLAQLGVCKGCGDTISTISYQYCYDCAKERDCCQCCGVER